MAGETDQAPRRRWPFFSRTSAPDTADVGGTARPATWNMGMLNDKETIAVPGSVLLLAKDHNEPLGLRNAPARTSHSSLPTGYPHEGQKESPHPSTPSSVPPKIEDDGKKKTSDGQIILDPQPDDSGNDPLNWPAWRRDIALLSLGLYCMVGGGITPLIAAGFTNVAEDYDVDVEEVALTTGLYMMGLGLGCVIFSPTAILFGKRPVYLFSVIIFILSAVWCALSPNFTSLILARIFQGIAVSPVECLPSATIAEIFFLHERAFRIGVYTLLLLGGKNLIPLISAVIIDSLSWRWVFWIVAIFVAFCGCLLFLFVPETFWDRTPIPRRHRPRRPSFISRRTLSRSSVPKAKKTGKDDDTAKAVGTSGVAGSDAQDLNEKSGRLSAAPSRPRSPHVGFAEPRREHDPASAEKPLDDEKDVQEKVPEHESGHPPASQHTHSQVRPHSERQVSFSNAIAPESPLSPPPDALYLGGPSGDHLRDQEAGVPEPDRNVLSDAESEKTTISNMPTITRGQIYTHALRKAPPKSFVEQLKIHNGRLSQDKWWKVALRPFILFSYPAVLWSSAIYACSVGWLIVISETVAVIYREGFYHFSALQTGLVYISPFVGGILGTAVAGKVSDVIVRAMARRNGGLYEPEFRLVMAAPIAVTTVVGLIGFGWSAHAEAPWIVPTIFFGLVSFGCSLGSTTSITFCVDSYRQYAGEALVTLNFSKNVLHGLVFSLFVTDWLTSDGPKTVFIWIGVMQLIILCFTVPMYIYGKRARMWTVRMNLMEKF